MLKNSFIRATRFLFLLALVLASVSAISHVEVASAAACLAADADDGASDGVITISGDTTWTPLDATAWNCSTLSLTVTNNATLTFASDTANGYYGYLQVVNLQIDSGSAISSDEKGCPRGGASQDGMAPNSSNVCTLGATGAGDGTSSGNGASGAGHGGEGGDGSTLTAGSATYDSSTAPVFFGASGGNSYEGWGGIGGGIVRIEASGTFQHNGSITADAGASTFCASGHDCAGGGGAGGSIYLTVTGAFSGSTGVFTADGTAGSVESTYEGGGGGGGRVSLTYGSSSFVGMDNTYFSVDGGAAGGDSAVAGTKGTVYVKNTGSNAVNIYHGFTFDDTDYSVANWTVDAGADNMYCESGTATPSITASGTLALDGTLSCDLSTITSFDFSAGTAFTVGSGMVMSIAGTGADVDFSIPAADDQTWTNFTYTGGVEGDFTINDAIDITLAGTSAVTSNVQWTNITSLNINSTSFISANDKGCQGIGNYNANGYGPNGSNVCTITTTGYSTGNSSGQGVGGASHGGLGGVGSTMAIGGTTYDTSTAPVFFGSSSGNSYNALGGSGGGIIRLQVTGAFTHNGALSADGTDGTLSAGWDSASGGGSGGSIYVTAGSIIESGGATGTFSADGGNGGADTSKYGGGGGGGMVAIEYGGDADSLVSNLTTAVVAAGALGGTGAADGSVGTLSKVQVVSLTSITIASSASYTNDSTPNIALTQSGATPTHVAFSCNGTNWSDWILYPDDDVVNDVDGPSWDMTTGIPGASNCTTDNDNKVIRAKIKNAESESSTASDSIGYDTVAPTLSYVTASNANGTYGASVVLGIQVVFNEDVINTGGAASIELDFDGTDRAAVYASGSYTPTLTFNYTTQNGDNKTDLDYTSTGALTTNGDTFTDRAGNTVTLTLDSVGGADSLAGRTDITISTNQSPTVATVTAVQSTDGTGDVTITFIMDDPDDDDTLRAKIQYDIGGGWLAATLNDDGDTPVADATYGTPRISNSSQWQVGGAEGYITTSSGANTISVTWEAATDVLATTDISNASIRITPTDNLVEGTKDTSSSFIVDLVDPATLASFASANASSASVDLSWTAATDTNFNHYEIWYGSNQTDVQGRTGTATEWDDSDDTDLTTASTATTTVSADPRTKYFKIYAVDDLGNETTLSDVLVSVSRSSSDANIGIPTNISVTDNASGGIILTWTDPDDTASTYVQIMRGISPYPVNASPIVNMPVGTQSYTDTEPTTGQIVVYMLRAYDGSNSGELTAQYSFTVGSTEETETNDSSGGGGSSSSSNDTDDDSDVLEEDLIDSLEDLGFYAPDHWSEGYLKNLDEVEQVLTQAVDMDLFHDILTNIFSSPDDGIDRGIVVQLLLTLSDYDVSSLTTNWLLQGFMDVGAEYVRANYIQFGYEHGLINGYPNGNFYPDKVVNRVEALKMAMYFFGIEVDANLFGNELLAEYNLTSNPFGDVDIEAWYAPYVIHAYDNGVVRGYGNGTFGPDNQVTYAEFVKIATLINDIENAVELASELE